MKIVYLSSSIIPSKTANSIHVMKMAQALANNGLQTILIAPDKAIDEQFKGLDIYQHYDVNNNFILEKIVWSKIKGRGYIYGLLAAIRAKKYKPDIVYGRNLAACFFASILGLQTAFEVHDSLQNKSSLEQTIFKIMVGRKNFVKLVAITHSLAADYIENFAIQKNKVFVAPDGADPVKEDIEVKNDILKVGYIGNLYQGRGAELILSLAAKCQDFAEFVIVGENHLGDIAGGENVKMLGYLPYAEAEKVRLSCDILLAPFQRIVKVSGDKGDTVKWMSPLKIFEYMAAGKAIIASDLPALREILENDVNAILLPPEDEQAWVDMIHQLANDEQMRKRLGAKAKEDFLQNYSWKMRAKNIIKALSNEES